MPKLNLKRMKSKLLMEHQIGQKKWLNKIGINPSLFQYQLVLLLPQSRDLPQFLNTQMLFTWEKRSVRNPKIAKLTMPLLVNHKVALSSSRRILKNIWTRLSNESVRDYRLWQLVLGCPRKRKSRKIPITPMDCRISKQPKNTRLARASQPKNTFPKCQPYP